VTKENNKVTNNLRTIQRSSLGSRMQWRAQKVGFEPVKNRFLALGSDVFAVLLFLIVTLKIFM